MKTKFGKRAWLAIVGAAVAALAVLAPAAAAETLTVTQNTDVAIPVGGNANPYPSTLKVEGADGNITDLNAKITLSHTFPDDVDIALVSPSGDEEVLMADVCGGTDVASVVFTIDSDAGAPISDSGPCSSGTFQPTNIGAGDEWGAPGGPGLVSTTQLGNFDGEVPNGEWDLFVLDDDGIGDGGTVESWSLTITTATAEVIVPGIGSGGVAKPYPSTKTFNTPAGKVISDVNFHTPDFSHTWPDDVDMMLAGPRRGATTMLMSDACGSADIGNFFWFFDDEAAKPMSDATITDCFPVTIKPSNFEGNENLPAPAPPGPYGSTLSVFDGLEGGAWRLFINDDAGEDTGYLSSWTLNVTTRDAADTGFAVASVRVEEGGKAVLEVKRTGPAPPLLGPATINVATEGTAQAGADYTAPATTLEFARGEAAKKIEIPIANDKVGEATERFKVVLSSPRDDARLKGNLSTEVTIGPDNEFKFGKLKLNAKKGTAKLFVKVPGPGKLVLSGEQVKKVTKTVKKAGNIGLPVKPKGNALELLDEEGSAKLRAKVAFTPTDGTVFKKTKKLKLIEN